MLLDVYNQEGEKISQTKLPKDIFEVGINADLIWQVLLSQMANKRAPIAHVKDRSEVSGGGRKPWRQKGTGRARHGSIRSPIWRGGGIAFGPTKEKVLRKRIPKKMKRKALFMVFSGKAKEGLIVILDSIKLEKPKTKIIVNIIKNLRKKIDNFEKGSTLLLISKKDEKIIKAGRNIPKFKTIEARNANVLDLLSFKYLLIPKESIKIIKETFLK